MRKLFIACCMLLFGLSNVSAQDDETTYGLADHLGVGVGVGTEGIGVNVATCLTPYFAVRLGVNVMPDFNISTSADVSGVSGTSYGSSSKVDVKGGIKRTTVDLKADFYPAPFASSFFITAGLSFGGKDVLAVSGHSDDFKTLASLASQYGISIGDYVIPFDANGDINGGVKVNSVRPYLGLGFGRLIPKGRLGARFEFGVQFQGTPTVYYSSNGQDIDLEKVLAEEADDNISKALKYFKVYPCIKFSLNGRIF